MHYILRLQKVNMLKLFRTILSCGWILFTKRVRIVYHLIAPAKKSIFIPGGCSLMAYQYSFMSKVLIDNMDILKGHDIVFEGFSSGAICAYLLNKLFYDDADPDVQKKYVSEFYEKILDSECTYDIRSIGEFIEENIIDCTVPECLKIHASSVSGSEVVNTLFDGLKVKDALKASIHIPYLSGDSMYHIIDGEKYLDGFFTGLLDKIVEASSPDRIIFFNNCKDHETFQKNDTVNYICGKGFESPRGMSSLARYRGYMFSKDKTAEILMTRGEKDATDAADDIRIRLLSFLKGNTYTAECLCKCEL